MSGGGRHKIEWNVVTNNFGTCPTDTYREVQGWTGVVENRGFLAGQDWTGIDCKEASAEGRLLGLRNDEEVLTLHITGPLKQLCPTNSESKGCKIRKNGYQEREEVLEIFID